MANHGFNILEIAGVAADGGVDFYLAVLNCFENYLLSTAQEGIEFVNQSGHHNVKVMQDTFHMNMEEESIGEQSVRQELIWDIFIPENVAVRFRARATHHGGKLLKLLTISDILVA